MVESFSGRATWYQPGTGEQGGTGTTSTGAPYTSTGFKAAIRKDLRHAFGGVNGRSGSGYAYVEGVARDGTVKKAIIEVNDVGPLKGKGIRGNRVGDFNVASRNYFGSAAAHVSFTPLPGKHYKAGPLPSHATYASVTGGNVLTQVADAIGSGVKKLAQSFKPADPGAPLSDAPSVRRPKASAGAQNRVANAKRHGIKLAGRKSRYKIAGLRKKGLRRLAKHRKGYSRYAALGRKPRRYSHYHKGRYAQKHPRFHSGKITARFFGHGDSPFAERNPNPIATRQGFSSGPGFS